MKRSFFDRALDLEGGLYARLIARAEDTGRDLNAHEVINEAQEVLYDYQVKLDAEAEDAYTKITIKMCKRVLGWKRTEAYDSELGKVKY